MSNKYVTERQVKEALNINNFREMSKSKIMEFVSLIPNMDKDVAISIINQFPAYTDAAKVMVRQMNDMCNSILEDNKDSRQESVAVYKQVLDILAKRLDTEGITPEESAYITSQMVDIADKVAAKDTENKKFLLNVFRYGTFAIGCALLVGGAILGVNVKGTKIPSIS